MAGISKLQMDAATITPEAKPARDRRTKSLSDFFIKNTQAEPSVVPKKGIMIPRKVSICLTAFALRFYLFVLNPASFMKKRRRRIFAPGSFLFKTAAVNLDKC